MMFENLPLDLFHVFASYSTHADFRYLLNTNKGSFQSIKRRLIVLNLNETKSQEYLTDVSFREKVLSVVEDGWKQVDVYVKEDDWNHSNLPSDVPVHALFVRPKLKKRGPSAFMIFCSEKRTELKAAHPNDTFTQIAKLLGEMWRQLDEKTKAVSIIPSPIEFTYCLVSDLELKCRHTRVNLSLDSPLITKCFSFQKCKSPLNY